MVVIIWLTLLGVSEKLSHNFLISEVILSDPPHWVMITRKSLGKGTIVYSRFMGRPILIKDLVGPKTLAAIQPHIS